MNPSKWHYLATIALARSFYQFESSGDQRRVSLIDIFNASAMRLPERLNPS